LIERPDRKEPVEKSRFLRFYLVSDKLAVGYTIR